jgi:methionyl aminopeptidase
MRCLLRWAAIATRRYTSAAAVQNDYGRYNVILPTEPFIWGVSHIRPRPVPQDIPRPAYALSGPSTERDTSQREDPQEGEVIVPLGGHEEECLRNAGRLAKQVRGYVETLIRVTFPPLLSLAQQQS